MAIPHHTFTAILGNVVNALRSVSPSPIEAGHKLIQDWIIEQAPPKFAELYADEGVRAWLDRTQIEFSFAGNFDVAAFQYLFFFAPPHFILSLTEDQVATLNALTKQDRERWERIQTANQKLHEFLKHFSSVTALVAAAPWIAPYVPPAQPKKAKKEPLGAQSVDAMLATLREAGFPGSPE